MKLPYTTAREPTIGSIILGSLSLVFFFAACTTPTGTESKRNSFSVGGLPTIEIQTEDGFVHVETGPAGTINVTAELRDPENVEYSVRQEGDTIIVRARSRSPDAKADITISVPENTAYVLGTGNGAVEITGVKADGTAASGNGSIKLRDVAGSVDASTGNGDIGVTKYTGDMVINTGNGKITVLGSNGVFVLNTGNGEITVIRAEGSFQLNSGNGSITLEAALAPGSSNSLGAGNGRVTVDFDGPPNVRLDLEIEEEGDIRNSLDVAVDEESARHLMGTIGSGDSFLRIRTGRGDIVLR